MDNERTFKIATRTDLLESKGVQLIWSILYKPETNSVAKRAVRTVKDWIIKNAQ